VPASLSLHYLCQPHSHSITCASLTLTQLPVPASLSLNYLCQPHSHSTTCASLTLTQLPVPASLSLNYLCQPHSHSITCASLTLTASLSLNYLCQPHSHSPMTSTGTTYLTVVMTITWKHDQGFSKSLTIQGCGSCTAATHALLQCCPSVVVKSNKAITITT
jgi:hypothetical protein